MIAWMASELGKERVTKVCEDLGYNKAFSYQKSELIASRFSLPADLSEFALGASGIGQDFGGADVKVLPYHLVTLISAIANNIAYLPYSISKVIDPEDDSIVSETQKTPVGKGIINISANETESIKAFMRGVCTDNGTAAALGNAMNDLGLTVYAKTSNAEFIEADNTGINSWIATFIEEEPVALVLVLQKPVTGNALDIAIVILPEAVKYVK
jgi:cell division protein FtsI/penicillin-binding protein 2